jgi:predicted small metal-binding protein
LNTVDTNGETDEELLKNGANHAIQQHGMNANDIYLDNIPTNLICHSFNKIIKKIDK